MFGFVFGTICLIALLGVARRAMYGHRRWHHGAGGCHGSHGGCHGHHQWRGRGGPRGLGEERFARAAGEVLKRRLHIDEEQEPIVDHALGDARAALKEAARELGETRTAIAEAFRGEVVDDAALAAAFARQDDAIGRARRELASAWKQVHAVLEPDQRARAADWLASADGRWA